MWGLLSDGVQECRDCKVWELQCLRVAVYGISVVWELLCVEI